MRIVVFSDSHNDFDVLCRAVRAQPQADMFLHLGDGQDEFDELREKFPDKRMMFVRGNCDWGSRAESEAVVTLGDRKIFLTHGHMYDVKRGTEKLRSKAKALGVDVACFGHTHNAATWRVDGVYMLNPGSIAFPRGTPPTYGVIDIADGEIAISIEEL